MKLINEAESGKHDKVKLVVIGNINKNKSSRR